MDGHGSFWGGIEGLDSLGMCIDGSTQSGRALLGKRGQLGEGGGVPPRGNDGVGGSDLPRPAPPPSGWTGAWGSPLSALSTLSLGFGETHGDLFPPPYHLAPIMADR